MASKIRKPGSGSAGRRAKTGSKKKIPMKGDNEAASLKTNKKAAPANGTTEPPEEPPPRDERKTFDSHKGIVVRLYRELDKLLAGVSAHREKLTAAYKAARANGIDIAALKGALADSKRDPKELAAEWSKRNLYMVWLHHQPKVQLGLFPDGRSVMTAIEDENNPPVTDTLAEALDKGRRLGHNSGNRDAHGYPAGTEHAKIAEQAWDEAQRGLSGTLASPDDRPAA